MPPTAAKRKTTPKPKPAEDADIVIFVRCTPKENARFQAKFESSGLRSYSEWVRQTLWNASAPEK